MDIDFAQLTEYQRYKLMASLIVPRPIALITTLGANSHAIRADSGASVAFTQNLPLPSAASKVSGAGAAVLSASGVGTTLLIQSASNSLAMSMTGDTTGTTNFPASTLLDGQTFQLNRTASFASIAS